MAESFGALLRECRAAAGISMGELARRVNYSKSYLSKIENDVKPPPTTMARLCDAVLDAGGVLIDAARSARERTEVRTGPDRRQVLGGVLGFALGGGPRPVPDERVVAGLRASFEQLRRLGRQASPSVVLEPLVAQVRTVYALGMENPDPMRSRLLLLAARIAEYIGWVSQESGDESGALGWTRRAAELGRGLGDHEIVSYALVREAGIALYRQDPIAVVDLARYAQQTGRVSTRTLGLAARREAQGHALAGDRAACERAFDRAAVLLETSTMDDKVYPVLGSTAPNPLELARGWSLTDLGQAGVAAAVLERELVRVPSTHRRTKAQFGARRSLAYALAGEIDQSCRSLAETIDDVAQVDSATVRMDLRELARSLSRWRGHHAVREIYPELSRVLQRR